MKPLTAEVGFSRANCFMDKIDIKEESLLDDLVSEFYNNTFSQF